MNSTSFFKRHPKLSIVVFNLSVLLIIFILFEIGLRIFTPDWLKYRIKLINTGKGYGYGTDANWQVKYKDGKFYSFTPNSTFRIYHEEYENIVNINNLGGRICSPHERTDTMNLIPFSGDSFVMGVGVEDTETAVALTKKKLDLNFINLGVGGTCLPIQRNLVDVRYNELGSPKVAIYGVFLGNDFDDIIKFNINKSTDSANAGKKNIPAPHNSESGWVWNLNNFINTNKFFKKIYTIQFIKQKLMNIRNANQDKARDHIDPAFLIMNFTDTEYINRAKQEMENEIQLLSKEPYNSILILIPDRYQINNSIRKSMCQYYNINESSIDPLLPNRIMIELLRKYNIPYIDPTQCISNHLNDGALYYTKDNHFTKLGQRVLTECVSDSLNTLIKQLNK